MPAAPSSSTGHTGTHTPCFSMARTQAASVAFLSSLSVMTRHTTSGGGRSREVGQQLRPLVRLAARHAQFEQAALGEQRQRLACMAQLIPVEAAIDEEHRAVRIAGRPRGRADGVGRFADQQRLVAGYQVHPRHILGERGGQLFGGQTQFDVTLRGVDSASNAITMPSKCVVLWAYLRWAPWAPPSGPVRGPTARTGRRESHGPIEHGLPCANSTGEFSLLDHVASLRSTLRIAAMVFQLRVVTATPYSRSNSPR